MQDNKYQKRRKQKKTAKIIASASLSGLLVLGIVSFLGRSIGSFTVKLDNSSVKLALSRKEISDEKSSFMMIDSLPTFDEYTYGDFYTSDLGDEILDNENYDYDMAAAVNKDKDSEALVSLDFFKYTFYVSNVGTVAAGYDLTFDVVENNISTDGTNRSLLDTLHVMMYENVVTDGLVTHNKTVYAKAPKEPRKDENGNLVNKEYVSTAPGSNKKFYGFAEAFNSDTEILKCSQNFLNLGAAVRYTIVMWIEGEDLSNQEYKTIPEGASLKLEVKVNGYESKQN